MDPYLQTPIYLRVAHREDFTRIFYNSSKRPGIATDCRLDDSGFEPRWGQEIFSCPHTSRAALCAVGTGYLSWG
jgi:hypothetical protein